jgi:hypothetical protein
VVYEVVDGQAVLVDPDGAELITLNRVGTLVWQELDGHRDTDELVAVLAGQFDDATPEDIGRDVVAFLAELEAGALISRGDAAG